MYLVKLGTSIFQKTKGVCEEFLPVFRRYYQFIVEENEETDLEYHSELKERDFMEGLDSNAAKGSGASADKLWNSSR